MSNKEVQYQDLPPQWMGNGKMVFAKLIFFPANFFFCSERFPFSKILKKSFGGKKINLAKKVGPTLQRSFYQKKNQKIIILAHSRICDKLQYLKKNFFFSHCGLKLCLIWDEKCIVIFLCEISLWVNVSKF
jgi:hypothetical protein